MLEAKGNKDSLVEFKFGLSEYELILIRNALYELYRDDPATVDIAAYLQRVYYDVGLALKGYELVETEWEWEEEELSEPVDWYEEEKLKVAGLNKRYPDLDDPFNGWFFPDKETGKFVE